MFKRTIILLLLSSSCLLSGSEYNNDFNTPESISGTTFRNFQKGQCASSIVEKDKSNMLKLSRDEAGGYSALRFSRIPFPVKKGEMLNGSINCLNNAKKANFHIYLQPGNKRLRCGSGKPTGKWQTLAIENWLADKDYEAIDIRLWCDGKGDVFFKNLKIKTEKLAEEWEKKQSFESTEFLQKCRMKNWGKGTAKAELTKEFVRDGKFALKLSRENPDGYSSLQLPDINLPVKKGKVVTVKIWCVNFCKRGSMHVELFPNRKKLRTGLSDMVEWGETLKVKFQADQDYQSMRIKLWVSGKGKVFFDKLQIKVGGKETLHEEVHYPCTNKLIDLPANAAHNGIIPFQTSLTKKVYPNYVPSAGELCNKPLKLTAVPGENRLLALGVYSKQFSGSITASVKGFQAVETVRYRPKMQKLRTEMKSSDYAVGPKILEPGMPLQLVPKQSGQFIIAFKVKKGADSGIQNGTIALTANDTILAEIPVSLEILPFALTEPPVERLMWSGWIFQEFAQDRDKLEALMTDMKEHGMTTVEGGLIPKLEFSNNDVTVDCSQLKTRIEVFHQVFKNKIMMVKGANNIGSAICRSMNPDWTDNVPARSKNPGLKDKKRWQLFDKAYAIWTDFLIDSDIEPYMYAYDEPGSHAWRDQAIETINHCKQVRPDTKIAITTTMEFAKTMNHGIDVNVFPYYADFNPVEARNFCKKHNDIFWVYGQCWSNAPRAAEVLRYEAGFYAWAIRTQGIGWWNYMYPVKDPYNDLDGKAQDFMMSYITPQGIIPTLNWEGISEGINDMKYLYTLEEAIEKNKASRTQAAAQAEKLITDIKSRIPMKGIYILSPSTIKNIPDAKQMDIWRNSVIEAIKSLI